MIDNSGGEIRLIPEVSDDEMVSGITLVFENLDLDQAGNYTCVISNNYGTLKKTVNVIVGKVNSAIIQNFRAILVNRGGGGIIPSIFYLIITSIHLY